MVSPDPYLNMRVLHNWDWSIDFSRTKHVAYLQMWMKNLLIPRQIKIMGQYVMHLNEMVVGTVNCIDGNNNNFYIIVKSMNIWVISTCLFYHWTNVFMWMNKYFIPSKHNMMGPSMLHQNEIVYWINVLSTYMWQNNCFIPSKHNIMGQSVLQQNELMLWSVNYIDGMSLVLCISIKYMIYII